MAPQTRCTLPAQDQTAHRCWRLARKLREAWVGLGKDVSAFVTTNMAEDVPTSRQKTFLPSRTGP